MLDINNPYIQHVKEIYTPIDIEGAAENIRKAFSSNEEEFSVFTTLSKLGTLVILHDDKQDTLTRYISFSNDKSKNYLVLSAGRTIEEMRFDAACMLRQLARQAEMNKHDFCLNYTTASKGFSREDKHFACALLISKNELIKFITKRDEEGKYLYLDENKEISFKNINIVADHFGVPFNQCSSRIFHVFEDLAMRKKGNFTLPSRRYFSIAGLK